MKYIYLITLFFTSLFYAQNFKTADSLVSIGQFSKAINEYQKENSIVKFFKIAKAFEAKGNSKEAFEYYQKYIQKDSLNLQVNYNYGLILLELSKSKEAKKVFQKLVDINANEVYHYYLGFAYEKGNYSENAIKNFLIASKMDPTYFKSNYKLAIQYANNSNYKEALEITNRFLAFDELNIEMLKLRAQIVFIQNDFSVAIHDFNTLISLNQTETFILEKLAASYYGNGEYDKSITIYTTLIDSAEEEKPEYFFNRGKCYGFLDKIKNAEADINKAIALKSFTFENEYFYLGYFNQKNQNLNKALTYYYKTVKQDKNHLEASYQIITINDYKGAKTEKTVLEYEKYLQRFKSISEERRVSIEARIKQLKQKQHME